MLSMEKQEVCERVIALIESKVYSDKGISLNDDLRDELGLDSLEIFELMCDCEEDFKIALPEDTYDVRTVQNLTDIVFKKIQG